ncbi:MAG: hypothetical protein CMH57_02695 [Myxococcales bacterium]|nr:hypothetical protein [Myxococcales bacterium]
MARNVPGYHVDVGPVGEQVVAWGEAIKAPTQNTVLIDNTHDAICARGLRWCAQRVASGAYWLDDTALGDIRSDRPDLVFETTWQETGRFIVSLAPHRRRIQPYFYFSVGLMRFRYRTLSGPGAWSSYVTATSDGIWTPTVLTLAAGERYEFRTEGKADGSSTLIDGTEGALGAEYSPEEYLRIRAQAFIQVEVTAADLALL